ncbi:MAG: NACHT domain-containing protein [Cyanobacteria bacterium P01_C01_bin.118]
MSELLTTTSALTGVAIPIFEIIWRTRDGLFGRFRAHRKRAQEKRQINTALLNYEKRFKEIHGSIRFIGKSESVDVNSVFTDVEYIANRECLQENDSLQALEIQETEFRDGRRLNKNRKARRKSVFDIAKKTPHLILLGGPGAGKTTFLRKVGIEALKPPKQSRYGHRCIPVFLPLKRLVSKNTNIEKIIREEFEISGIPDAKEFTREALRTGKLLILLDGVDEIPYANLNNALAKIKEFVNDYGSNRYVASCREGAHYHRFLESFMAVQIADFSDCQIRNFVKFWFATEAIDDDQPQAKEINTERRKKFLTMLQKDRNSAVKELARNPLLLTLLCLVYQGSNNLPNNRVSLFQQALELFINKWFAFKKVQPNPILDQEFDPILERAMLSEVAYKGFISDRVFFKRSALVHHIRAYMEANLNAPDLDSQEVLDTIKIYQGILIDQVQDYYSFSHVAFQEYLTAKYIYDNDKLHELVQNYIFDQRWQEVFSMVSGSLISGSDKLLRQMVYVSKEDLDDERVRGVVAWSEKSVSAKVQAFANKLPLCADHIKGKHLECRAWDLIIKHAATFYVLGALLYSYTDALKGCGENEVNSISHHMDLSNMLMKYSSALISQVHEYLSAKSFKSSKGDELQYFINLTGTIKNTGILSKSVIKIEGHKRHLSKLRKLREQLKKTGIFHNLKTTPLRKNLALLEQKEALGKKYSVEESKFLIRQMWRNWQHSLGLSSLDITEMSKDEGKLLEKYLYTNLLIINCRIRAVKISHDSWNKTLLQMMQRAV